MYDIPQEQVQSLKTNPHCQATRRAVWPQFAPRKNDGCTFTNLADINSIMDTLETTVEKLKALPSEKFEEVAHYIDSLSGAPKAPKAPKSRFDDLAGCLSADEADRLEHAINESSERIDPPQQGW